MTLPNKLLFCVGVLALSVFCRAERVAPPLAELVAEWASGGGAEVLYAYDRREFQPDHHWHSVHYRAIRINDIEAARDYGRIRLGFNHYYSDLELDYANVLTPEGELKSVAEDALQESTGGGQDFYEDRSGLTFSLPDIKPGAVLEFQFRRKSRKLSLDSVVRDDSFSYWYQMTVGGMGARMDPVRQATYELVVPQELSLHKRVSGPVEPDYQHSVVGDKQHHVWTWQSLPKVHIERAMPPLQPMLSMVQVSSSRDWNLVGDWTLDLMDGKVSTSTEIQRLARSLASDNDSPHTKVQKVYAWVQQNIRYVFAHLGRGGYEPHTAEEILKQGYGDCKDQTVLVLSLLRALDIEAYPALVATRRQNQPDTTLVSLPFDHMVVWLPNADQGRPLWLDTTGDRTLFPGFSSYLEGQPGLIIEGRGKSRLVELDPRLPDNFAVLNLHYYVDDREHLRVDASVDLSGIYEQSMRNWWVTDSERESSLRDLIHQVFPGATPEMFQAEVTDADSLWHGIGLKGYFDFGPAWQEGEKSTAYTLGLPQVFRLFGNLASLQAPQDRYQPWYEPYALQLSVRATMEAEGLTPAVLASGVDVESDFFKVHQSGRAEGDSYKVEVDYFREPLNLSLEEYRRYHSAINQLGNQESWTVAFSETDTETASTAVAADDLQSQLKLARQHLEQGRFEEALTLAERILDIEYDNGEAWYILASAQGFTGMVDESIRSFGRAESLGYVP